MSIRTESDNENKRIARNEKFIRSGWMRTNFNERATRVLNRKYNQIRSSAQWCFKVLFARIEFLVSTNFGRSCLLLYNRPLLHSTISFSLLAAITKKNHFDSSIAAQSNYLTQNYSYLYVLCNWCNSMIIYIASHIPRARLAVIRIVQREEIRRAAIGMSYWTKYV